MDAYLLNWLSSLVVGLVLGVAAGLLFRRFSLGLAGDAIAGALGGGFGGQILGVLLTADALVVAGVGATLAGAALGGAGLTLFFGAICMSCEREVVQAGTSPRALPPRVVARSLIPDESRRASATNLVYLSDRRHG